QVHDRCFPKPLKTPPIPPLGPPARPDPLPRTETLISPSLTTRARKFQSAGLERVFRVTLEGATQLSECTPAVDGHHGFFVRRLRQKARRLMTWLRIQLRGQIGPAPFNAARPQTIAVRLSSRPSTASEL